MPLCKTLDKIKDKKFKKRITQSSKATSAQGASLVTRKTKHRHKKKKSLKAYTGSIQEEGMCAQQEGQSQGLRRILLELRKEDFQTSLGQNLKRETFFQVWVSEEVQRLPEGI